MKEYSLREFKSGLVTRIEDFSIPEDAASKSLNWRTMGDKIELSGGYKIVGNENGAGKVTGLAIGSKVDGDKLALRTRGQRLEYYDIATEDWVESGTNILGADADGEDTSIVFYTSLSGYQAWVSSPNSGLFKLMLASPGSPKDQYNDAKNFKGYLINANGRLLLWYRLNNKNYIYGSYKDVQNATVYTDVSAEAIGASGSTNYTGTLAAVTGRRTCFNVVFTDGTQIMQDDKNGGFTGDGTGTIDYATGAYDIDFNATTTGSVTANYSWEDSNNKGLADFTFDATRLATQGFFLPQPTGGDLLTIQSYRTDYYCLHEDNTWLFSMPVDDLSPTNQVFRENTGVSSFRAAVATGEGIYYIDTSNPSQPKFRLLTLENQNDQVVPLEFSFNVDLSGFDFTNGVAWKWDEYIVFTGKTIGSDVPNRLFAFHTTWKSFDVFNYQVNCLATNGSELWAGEPSTDNVVKLFSGYTANETIIQNYWEGKLTRLQMDDLKKFKRLTIHGEISRDQVTDVFISYDGGNFDLIGTIEGTGDYVSSSSTALVGGSEIGEEEVAGGGDGSDRLPFVYEIRVRSPKFEKVKVRFEARGVGYMSVTEINYFDIRGYGKKNLNRYRT